MHTIDGEDAERKLREELLSALNHDLRSPLGAIGIFCEILQLNPTALDDNQRQSLSMIQEANGKALRILDDVAELHQIYKGTLQLHPSPVDLRKIVEDLIQVLTETSTQKGVQLQLEPGGAVPVMLDREKLEQLIIRLIEEPIMTTTKGATVALVVTADEQTAQLRIESENLLPDGPSKRPPPASVKGRLGVRKAGESRFSLRACEKLAALMGGELDIRWEPHYQAVLRVPLSTA